MARKTRSKKASPASNIARRSDAQPKTPRIVEEINESDDEEIPEDEAFNSEDERLFGHFFIEGNEKGNDQNKYQHDPTTTLSSEEVITSESDTDDGDDDENDGGQYMLDLLNKLDTKIGSDSKSDLSLAQMTKIPESEYSNSMSKEELTLDNLMEGIQDTQGFRDLQKALSSKPMTTQAPLDKKTAGRVERKIAYRARSKDVSRWVDIIQENRQAESLDFKSHDRLQLSRDVLVDKFEAKTSFEKEIEEALREAGQQDEEAVLKGEEEALQDDLGANRLTMEEYKKRRGQLAQIRALMFYHERKRHQMKKIKSRKYRRIRKKQRDRLKESAMESAMEQDKDFAKELKEKEEVARIKERMTLAHKNTSKWAKRILKRGKNVDVDTRRALSAQIQRGDDLRRKMVGSDEESDDNTDDEDLIESARKVLHETENDEDPTHGKTGLFKLSFMQKGIQKQREKAREEARKLLGELRENEIDDYDEMVQSEDSESNLVERDINVSSAKEMSSGLEKGELVASSLEFGNSNAIATSNCIEIDLNTSNNDTIHKLDESEGTNIKSSANQEAANPSVPINNGNSEYVTLMEFNKLESNKSDNSTISSRKPLNNKLKIEGTSHSPAKGTKQSEIEKANPWMKTDSEKCSSAMKVKKTTSKNVIDVPGAAEILNVNKERNDETKDIAKRESKEEENDKKITSLTQEELVRRAFVGQNESQIQEEFKKEKEEMVAANDPTLKVGKRDLVNEEVVGWGSWTGQGAPPPKPRKLPKKLRAPKKKKEEKRKRSYHYKPDVIINEKRLKKTANNFMLADIPHPYASRAEYEQSMMGGVGREWNVSSSFKNMTRPEILTRSGKIIQPISKKAKKPRAAAKF
eukprot:CAMPEP_0197177914 /NCGR_PEP_ID=MMETSP1423-20130617/3350_1 /TAXON_ID=476441 /ORGANISM="Pseudo-nitzschia heimii, Strain UNC1101" /LENGTH=863 /DNA_ID=CAMNT_0042627537 /DNA_START=34 /DNA_END=2625 /DNA_ORIENTATION=+